MAITFTKATRTRTSSYSAEHTRLRALIAAVARGERDALFVTHNGSVYSPSCDPGKPLVRVPELTQVVTRGKHKGQAPSFDEVVNRVQSLLSVANGYDKGTFSTARGLIPGKEEGSQIDALCIAKK